MYMYGTSCMNCAKEDSSANAARVHVETLFIIIGKHPHQAPSTKRQSPRDSSLTAERIFFTPHEIPASNTSPERFEDRDTESPK